jgi:hypothetical protein
MGESAEAEEGGRKDEEPVRQVQALLEAVAAVELFRAGDGRILASVRVDDRSQMLSLKKGFRDWLIRGYFAEHGEPPSSWAVSRVIGLLEAQARFAGNAPAPAVRAGRDRDPNVIAYYIDLGDASGRAIRITAGGWEIVDHPNVDFRRPPGQRALPVPARGGSLELLRPFVNLDEPSFRLVIVWLTWSILPIGPYVILCLTGEQGSAKTTLAEMLGRMIDPHAPQLLILPDSVRNLMVTADHTWLLNYNNISAISPQISDCLCQIIHGAGYAARALFSDDDRFVIEAQRPSLLNGIFEFARRGDFVDRAAIIRMQAIPEENRRGREEFWSAFDGVHPQIQGALYDIIAGGLRELPNVSLPKLPRMADFARWGEAVSRALGWEPGCFQAIYAGNRRLAISPLLEDSPVATALMELFQNRPTWSGKSTSLQAALTLHVDAKEDLLLNRLRSHSRRWQRMVTAKWPKSQREFANELRRVIPQLRVLGFHVEFKRTTHERQVVIANTNAIPTARKVNEL